MQQQPDGDGDRRGHAFHPNCRCGLNSFAVSVNSATNRIYVVNNCGSDPDCRSAGTVTVIDGATLSTQTVTVGYNPQSVTVDSVANKIYVANVCGSDPFCLGSSTGTVTAIDGSTLSTQTVTVGFEPLSLGVNYVTDKVYVANSCINDPSCKFSGTMTVIDGATLSTQTLNLGGNPDFVGVNAVTNEIYVGSCDSDINCGSQPTVTEIDGATLSTTAVSVCSVSGEFPTDVEVDATTNKVYVSCAGFPSSVTVIDGATNSTTSVTVGYDASSAVVNSATNRIYVTNTRTTPSLSSLGQSLVSTI